MPNDRKTKPQLPPPDLGSLSRNLEQGLLDESAARNVTVSLRVSGGMPAQAYHFEFSTTGGMAVRCHVKCLLRDRDLAAKSSTLEKGDFQKLLKQIKASRILEKASESPRFLPDTLVGVLEISDGQSHQRTWFAADEAQAAVQQKEMRPELRKLVEAIYALGARLLKQRSIKP